MARLLLWWRPFFAIDAAYGPGRLAVPRRAIPSRSGGFHRQEYDDRAAALDVAMDSGDISTIGSLLVEVFDAS